MSDPLLCLACSATKRHDEGSIPAIDRYDGPMWRTLRAALRVNVRPVSVWVLSARFGFLPAETCIPDYERVMTERRAAEILRLPSLDAAIFASAVAPARHVMFAGGDLYRATMRRACQFIDLSQLTETEGPGIGHHRAELRAWLTSI